MKEIALHDISGKVVGSLKLPKALHEDKVNCGLLHKAVLMYENNQRVKLAATKTRGRVSGGGKKPWRQKGTGRSRVGSSRNPIWRGGGVTFGPVPRNSHYSIPRRMKLEALKNSIIDKLIEKKLIVLERLKIDKPKTQLLSSILTALGVKEKSLLLLPKLDGHLHLAVKNLPHVALKLVTEVNAYNILRVKKLILTKSALEKLVERLR